MVVEGVVAGVARMGLYKSVSNGFDAFVWYGVWGFVGRVKICSGRSFVDIHTRACLVSQRTADQCDIQGSIAFLFLSLWACTALKDYYFFWSHPVRA